VRFKVLLVHLSATAAEYGRPPTMWRVVDTKYDFPVEASLYERREDAEARAERENREADAGE